MRNKRTGSDGLIGISIEIIKEEDWGRTGGSTEGLRGGTGV